MRIAAHGLTLQLTPVDHLNDEDWCRVRVVASVPGFTADFVAHLQGVDLEAFRAGVASMYESVGQPNQAALSCAEPGISLKLAMQTLGGIEGTYEFQGEFAEPSAPRLSGGFQIDQSYLPLLSSEIDQLLEELRGA